MKQLWQHFISKLRNKLVHFRADSDIEEELHLHLQMQTEDNEALGIARAEAQRRARLLLGRPVGIIEAIRDGEFVTLLESCYQDFVFALRAMRKEPVFCVTAILTLALGIGANTAIFAVLYGLLLRSLPVDHPDRLARVSLKSAASKANFEGSGLPYRMFEAYRNQQHSFEDLAAWDGSQITLRDQSGAERISSAEFAGGDAFRLLHLHAYIGRLLNSSDDVRGGPADGWPVVLDYGFWHDRFAGDPHILGKQLELSGIPATVVGVAPPNFHGLWSGFNNNLYLPLRFESQLYGEGDIDSPSTSFKCAAIGRLRPGVSIADANREIARYQARLLREFIPLHLQQLTYYQRASLQIASARAGFPSYFGHVYSEPLYLMQSLVAVVLLLCCVNVAGLMVSKVYSRRHEFAVRTAIGAARWRLIRQYLTESFVLALISALLGSLAAWRGSNLLLQFFRDPNMSEPISVQPGGVIFLAGAAFTIFVTFAFGMIPAWRVGAADPGYLLKSRTAAGRTRQFAGKVFVPVQVALSLVLVTLAALLSQSLVHLRAERTGFDLDRVTIQTPPFQLLPQKDEAKLHLYQEMVNRIEQMPGIRAAAVTWLTPMTGTQPAARVEAVGNPSERHIDSHMPYNEVGSGYFRAIGIQLLSGREFTPAERQPNVCLLNRAAANYLFPHQQALGQFVRTSDQNFASPLISCRIIGIAADAKFGSLRDAPPRTLYLPLSNTAVNGGLVFLINSDQKKSAVEAYRKALEELVPSMPLVLFVTLREQMDAALGSQRLITVMSNFFGLLALLLSALGLYGLLSSSVAQRRPEIGVRLALGAQRRTVVGMILSDALRLLASGLLLGSVVLLFALKFAAGLLYHVSIFNVFTFGTVLAVLIAVALVAAIIPALRAASVDPIEALRAE